MESHIYSDQGSPVLVTGGTGTLGRLVVPRLQAQGKTVRVLSRNGGSGEVAGVEYVAGDLETGAGIRSAIEGTQTVLHLAGSSGGKGDVRQTENLVEAARHADVSHFVYISVVGADRVPQVSGVDRAMFGYFGAKRKAERIVADSGLPWTTLRATQFHQLMLMMAEGMAKLPIVPVVAGFRFQPVDGSEVADRLVELALGAPSGLVPDIGGPAVYGMKQLIGKYLEVVGKRRPTLPLRLPGRAARAFRAGANLSPAQAVGSITWEEFLAANLAARAEDDGAAVGT